MLRPHLFKAEQIKQLSLILLQPTHHGPFPPLTASTSGNHCSPQPSTDFCNKICQQETHAPQQTSRHSITSSARCWSSAGTSKPSALAVLRLIVSIYLVGNWTGKSVGLAPLRMRST